MSQMKDETGKQYGDWTVLERVESSAKWARWKCRCKCGDEHVVPGYALRKGLSTKCSPCANSLVRGIERKPMMGQTFGRWKVLRRAPAHEVGQAALWWCECECGTEKAVRGSHLRTGASNGCAECHGKDHRREADTVGAKFGKWTVLRLRNARQSGAAMYDCLCECGNEAGVRGVALRSGQSTGCASCSQPKAPQPLSGSAAVIDMTGMQVGLWKVQRQVQVTGRTSGQAMWLCECACGFIMTIIGSQLRSGKCMMCIACRRKTEEQEEVESMIGNRYGNWTVIGAGPSTPRHGKTYVCLCDCGMTTKVRANNLRAGKSNACVRCRGRSKADAALKRLEQKHAEAVESVDDKAARRRAADLAAALAITAHQSDTKARDEFEALTIDERSAVTKPRPLRLVTPVDTKLVAKRYRYMADNFNDWFRERAANQS